MTVHVKLSLVIIHFLVDYFSCTLSLDGYDALLEARELVRINSTEEAKKLFARAIAFAEGATGREHELSYNVNSTIKELQQLFQDKNQIEEAYIYIGNFFLEENKKNLGVSYLEKAISENPDSIEAHLLLAQHIGGDNKIDLEERMKHYMLAAKVKPSDVKVSFLSFYDIQSRIAAVLLIHSCFHPHVIRKGFYECGNVTVRTSKVERVSISSPNSYNILIISWLCAIIILNIQCSVHPYIYRHIIFYLILSSRLIRLYKLCPLIRYTNVLLMYFISTV